MIWGGGVGPGYVHPSTLVATWSSRYGKPLAIFKQAPKEYLLCIFISSLIGAPTISSLIGAPTMARHVGCLNSASLDMGPGGRW